MATKDIYNPSGLSPTEMSQRTVELSDIARSKQTAAQPVYDFSKDALNQPPTKIPAIQATGDSSLTSAPAKAFVGDVSKQVTGRQAQIQADVQASDQKLADLDRILKQQSSNLIQNQLKAAETAQKPLKESFAITAEQTAASRKEAEASQKVAAFRMEQAATPYAEAATAKRQRTYELQDKQRAIQENELLNQAWDSALRGEINISQRLLGEAQTAMGERQRIRDDARAEQEMTMKLAEYEDTRALKAQDRAMSTVQNLVSAGFTVDQLPDSYLNELDTQAGMPKGFSSQVFQTTKSAQEAQVVQDVEERRSKELDNAMKVVNLMDKVPLGKSVQVGGNVYYGTSRGNIKSGVEKDEEDNLVYYEVNQDTKKVETVKIGSGFGDPKDGWETATDDQGRMWFVNPKTRQTQPAFPSEGQKALEDIIPDDTVWQRDGVDAPECGQFVNDLTGAGLGDSYESKLAKVDSSIKAGTSNPPRYGDFFVQSTSTWTGHTGIVVGSEIAPDGETYIFTKESNYPKPGVINSRRIKASEVAGFGRTGNLAPGLQVGSDKPTFGKKEVEDKTAEQSSVLRKELQALPEVKEFKIIRDAYAQIQTVGKTPSAAGDISLIFSYMKLLDPNSVVREGEFATAQNAAGIPDIVRNTWNRALKGQRLNDNQRDDFIGKAKDIYGSKKQQIEPTVNQYRGLAKKQGLSPEDVVLDFYYTPSNKLTVSSPDGKTKLEYDLTNPDQKVEYEEALKAGYK